MSTAFTAPAFAAIEIVTVTAQKRAEDVQSVPVAISVFTGEKRDAMGILSIQDMTNFTPGLQYSTATDRVSLRGVGRLTNVLSADASVANYDDGLYETFAVAAGRSSLDLDRVEVLRGPQGTLYGRNAIAGALNEITRRPTDTLQSEVRVTYRNYDYLTAEGYISGPIIDDWQYKLYGSYDRQTKGYSKNIIPGAPDEGNVIDEWYFDGQIQNKFSQNFEMWTKVQSAGWQNGAGGPGSASGGWHPNDAPTYEQGSAATGLNPSYGCTAPGFTNATANTNVASAISPLPAATACRNPSVTTPWLIDRQVPYKVTLPVYWSLNSQWTWHADTFDVKYIVGGTYYHYHLQGPTCPGCGGSGTQAPITSYKINSAATLTQLTIAGNEAFDYQEKNGFFSNEVNFISTDNSALQWQAGLYQFFQHYNQPVFTTEPSQPQWNGPFGSPGFFCAKTGGVCPPETGFRRFDNRPSVKAMSLAAYFQLDYKLDETLKLTGGLRYSWDRKWGEEQVRLLCFASCVVTPEGLGAFTPAFDLTQLPEAFGGPIASGTTGLPRGVTGLTTYSATTGLARRGYNASWDMLTGTVGVEWTPDEDTLVYGKYSKGYKSGGFNIGIFTVLSFSPWTDKEKVDSFEIGAKRTFGDWLVLNTAIFHYDYKNLQIPIAIVQTTGGFSQNNTAFFNLPQAVSQGFEVEAQVSPIENLAILFNYSFLDAHVTKGTLADPADPNATAPGAIPLYTDAQCLASHGPGTTALPGSVCTRDIYTIGAAPGGVGWNKPQNIAGNPLPNAPRNKIAFNVLYNWKMDWGTLTPSVSYVWRDVQYGGGTGSLFKRTYNAAPAWDQWDARIRYQAPDDQYEVILFGRNIANTIGHDGGANGFRLAGTIRDATGAVATNFVQGGAAGTTPAPVGYGAVRGEDATGHVTTFSPTPPRTFGIEVHYKLF